MTNENITPVGSITKPFTGVGILRLYEEGKLDLNDTIDKHVDKFLMKINGSTILDIWQGNQKIKNVTIYHLLHMTSGLKDYNDTVKLWTWAHPNEDYSPLDYIYDVPKSFECDPGTCTSYCSIGFELLGFVLAYHAGVDTWEEYDQMSVIPESIRNEFKHTVFGAKGKCTQYAKDGII